MGEVHRRFSDKEFLQKFEAAELGAEALSHEAHFRIAWIYLKENRFEAALEKVTDGIQRFDNKYAGGRKYHATITRAYMLLIYQRMKKKEYSSWPSFIEENRDLLRPVGDLLLRYYHPETLFSEEAKKNYLNPDKEPV